MRLIGVTAGVAVLGAVAATMIEPVVRLPEVAPMRARGPQASAAASLLYGRVTTSDAVFEGRLRWGGDQEALWSNYFNGARDGNRWARYAPSERESLELFGITVATWTHQANPARPFMARFGDLARIDRDGRVWRVTLKSGAVATIAWAGADDMNDGVRIWDRARGAVTLPESRIRRIEFLDSAPQGASVSPLYGTVRTRHGDFTGLVQWNRRACLGSDILQGQTGGADLRVAFETIRSIARALGGSRVTFVDGREVMLSGDRGIAQAPAGIYVDDPRYGRVLVSWEAFERVDFAAGGIGPAYADFAPGRPLTGTVITRAGHRLSGRLVYDLDETETTETLDAPSRGIDYTIPFDRIASITVPVAQGEGATPISVTLRSGERLQLERDGDLARWNAGMLVFVEGRSQPEYVRWADVRQVSF